ncbi:hypothetical protein BS78_02G290100 [Paspalum vaginatum]|nr:hypothetical protein BS78_02G290100 [Paspalum vaginatum]
MIMKNIVPGQKLAVGKREYGEIIQHRLGITCLFDENVLELMWGLKNCMHHLVPAETKELTKEDRLHMSEGMKTVFRRYGLEVEPEMVNKDIIKMTLMVYCCDRLVNNHSESLRAAAKHLKDISAIDAEHWGLFKIATALKILSLPEEILPGDPRKLFSRDEYSKLLNDGHLYDDKLLKGACKMVFEEVFKVRIDRHRVIRVLIHDVREARKKYEAAQGLVSSS